ncbi:MAG: hypothetical protein IKJ87_05330 [Ruminococcus sp.]|nr:hypothetical protein [Ruminococcus sp.]
MEQPNILRETKGMQKGYVKEDVLMYLDELNSRNEELKKQLQEMSGQQPADSQELIKYRNQIDNLQEKLNASNNALRVAKKENEELHQQIEKLKAGGASAGAAATGAAAVDSQTKAALEAAKKEIDTLRNQLKAANDKAAAPAANNNVQAAVEAAKKEIDSLKNQLKAANDKAAEAEKKAAGNNGNSAAEIAKANQEAAKANQEIAKISAELKSKSAELDTANKNAAELDKKIQQLTKDVEEAAKKDEEIAKLNSEIIELKETANNPAALMGSLFAEAQKTVTQLKLQAEQEASKTTKEADEKAAAVIREANAAAEKTVREANMTAEKTINEANSAAEKAIREANMQAKMAVDDANAKAGKINEMSATVRSMLLNEINSVNNKFNDITNSLSKLTGQATDRMQEAQVIIGEAKKAVEPNNENTVKLAEAPKAEFTAAKAPVASLNKSENSADAKSDPFSQVTGGSYNSRGASNGFNNKPASNSAPAHDAPKAAPKKPVNNFSFDMSDLLKAAEEEAAKDEQ